MAKQEAANPSFDEIGSLGLKITGGVPQEEFHRDLKGKRGREVFLEMAENDPIIGASLFVIEMILRGVDFRLVPSQADAAGRGVDTINAALESLDHGMSDFISNVCTMFVYGFALFEKVYETRPDGVIGIRKLAPRGARSIEKWIMDTQGNIQAVVQRHVGSGLSATIPYQRLLHFKTKPAGGNPEGRSVLRSAYIPYYHIKALTRIETTGIERDLNGFPVLYVPPEAMANDAQKQTLEKFVSNIKMNEQSGALLSSKPYEHPQTKELTNTPRYKLELLSSPSSRPQSAHNAIMRHQKNASLCVLADFIMLGGEVGAYALSADKTDMFTLAVQGFAKSIEAVLNKGLIRELCYLNGLPDELHPYFQADKVAKVSVDTFARAVRDLSAAGFAFDDPQTQNEVREKIGLAEIDNGNTAAA